MMVAAKISVAIAVILLVAGNLMAVGAALVVGRDLDFGGPVRALLGAIVYAGAIGFVLS